MNHSITPRDLECMVCDEMAEPKALPLSLLEEITDGFSDEQQIGIGGFAVVYKGMLENRTVAVKRMSDAYMDEKVFHREVECLMEVKHKNVVRFLGYCANTQGSMERYDGKFVMADVYQRLLCFEYLSKGSLDKYITDMSCGLQWRDRYQIITGICQGLHYLHQKKIVHLDLKPANILLDDCLVPKITDFGLSRCFGEMQSRVITKIAGTIGYLAPESFNTTKVTYRHLYRLDIFSLGVVITEMLTGEKGYHDVDNVVESWSSIVDKSKSNVTLKQVRVCAEIAVECIDSNPAKRPDTEHIIDRLNEYMETSLIISLQAEDALNELHQDAPNAPAETSSEAELGPNELHLDTPKAPGEASSEENPNAKLDMFNETMHSLNEDIRRCLEYCSIFPRGSKLIRDELVRLWIAQGFVKTSCAIEDIEDVANGYIQELVVCSCLQPEETGAPGAYFFTIHDVLQDILDKVARNCFRIENTRSHGGEGWGGDVPQDVQHLFLQKYDAKLITEKILGLKNLRTLVIYVVEEGIPVEEEVIESICKRLTELRVLAITFKEGPYKFLVPESIGQLKHLCYLAFRTRRSCSVILPSSLNELQNIQLLDFGNGYIFSEFTSIGFINLRYITCELRRTLRNIGRLISLRIMPHSFVVRNEPGYELKQLRDLNKLRDSLWIRGLGNVKSKAEALEANLAAKGRLTKLELSWHGDTWRSPEVGGDNWSSPEVEAEVLEGLCPPVGLEKLVISNYKGSRYPDWMEGKQNGGPKNLQELEFLSCSQRGPAPQFVEAFPYLCVLLLWGSWDSLPGNMEHLTLLKKLVINTCWNIRSLPTLPPSLEVFSLVDCDDEFMGSCQKVGHPNWQKIEHIPEKTFGDPAGSQTPWWLIRGEMSIESWFK